MTPEERQKQTVRNNSRIPLISRDVKDIRSLQEG